MFRHVTDNRTKPYWLICILLLCLIPVFPEYICIPLAVAAVFFAYFDCKQAGIGLQMGSIGPWIIAYTVYMAFSSLFSDNSLQTLATSGMWAVAFLAYVAAYSVLRDEHRLQITLKGFGITVGALGLLGTVQHICNRILLWPVPVQLWIKLDDWVYQWFPMELMNHHGLRAAGTFNNSNVYACYLILALPLLIGLALSVKNNKQRIFFRCCLLTTATGIAFSFSRSGYLALLAVVALFVIFTVRRNNALWLSLLSAALLVPDSVVRRFTTFNLSDIAVIERLRIWLISLHSIAAQPLWGLGGGVQNTWDMLLQNKINAPHTHNLLLQLLCEGGVFALTMIAFALGIVWRNARRLKAKVPSQFFLGLSQQGWILALLIFGLTEFPFLAPKNVTFFLLLLALSDGSSRLFLNLSPFSLQWPYRKKKPSSAA